MTKKTRQTDAAKTELLEPETSRALVPRFTKGGVGGPGRPPGALNRTTVVMKNAIATVFRDLQEGHDGPGDHPHFLAWAQSNPTDFYRIAAKLIPVQLETSAKMIGQIVFKGVND